MCCVWLTLVLPVQGQHEGFIYGTVTLVNDETYTGQIRWSDGQTLWGDIFRAEKKENLLLKYLNEDQLKRLSEEETRNNYDWGFMDLWKNKYPTRSQTLKCRFGDMASLQVTGDDEATIVLKNGAKVAVESTDEDDNLGDPITVHDAAKGRTKVEWDKITQIRFSATPPKLPQIKASLLYGTVQTPAGAFTGFIRWDEDEFLTTNNLDGRSAENKEKGIAYGTIRTIEAKDKGVVATLASGEQIYLWGMSNVNFSNNGIVVQHPAWGRVIISWKAFRSVTFAEAPANLGYDSYETPKPIRGTVLTTTNIAIKNNFVYDLDERFNIELLDAESDLGIRVQFLFKIIRKITVKNHSYTEVLLRDGKKMLLTGEPDVTNKNWGIMVWLPQNKYKYIPWNRLRSITLE